MDWVMSYGWTGMVSWGLMAWAVGAALVVLLATLAASRPARRHSWCEQAGCEVDVEFEEHGVPGLRRFIAVRRCSAFEPTTAVTCRRSCLHRGTLGDTPSQPEDREAPPPHLGPHRNTPSHASGSWTGGNASRNS